MPSGTGSFLPTYHIRLSRTDPGADTQFTLDLDSPMTVLDALFIIQREHDPSLAFRCSCRVGMCGTCAMRVNWMPRLACQTRVETLRTDAITIEPLATGRVSQVGQAFSLTENRSKTGSKA